jgi:phosphoribosylanthranilate isomerase
VPVRVQIAGVSSLEEALAAAEAGADALGFTLRLPTGVHDGLTETKARDLLDTYDPATGRGGATGKTHDWAISREIVAAVQVPVILAGGLTPDNIVAAIQAVSPWAVDVHTGIENPDGTRNLTKLRSFITRAKGAQ